MIRKCLTFCVLFLSITNDENGETHKKADEGIDQSTKPQNHTDDGHDHNQTPDEEHQEDFSKMYLYQRKKLIPDEQNLIDLQYGFDKQNLISVDTQKFQVDLSNSDVLINLNHRDCLPKDDCIIEGSKTIIKESYNDQIQYTFF